MKKLSIVLLLAATAAACGDDSNHVVDAAGDAPTPDGPGPAVYKQVEHLGRPGINEALLSTFGYNNGYNATAPSFTGVDAATLALVVGEAKTTLKALYLGVCLLDGAQPGGITLTAATGLKPAGMQCPDIGPAVWTENTLAGVTISTTSAAAAQAYADKVFSQFEPDVLRIDTSAASGYLTLCSAPTDATPLLCGGRNITDDVIDVTYNYLLGGAAITNASNPQFIALVSDGVVYNNAAANLTNNPTSLSLPSTTNGNQGHPATSGTFPYSAPPI